MNEELKELEETRQAVTNTFNDFYDNLKMEVYEETIKTLKAYIADLEGELDTVRYLYENQVKISKEWQKQADFMARAKRIKPN